MPPKRKTVALSDDLGRYIGKSEDIKEMIALAFVDSEPAVIIKMLGAIARSHGMSALAEETGIARNSLYKSLAEDGNPRFATVTKVINALGLKLVVIPGSEERKVRPSGIKLKPELSQLSRRQSKTQR